MSQQLNFQNFQANNDNKLVQLVSFKVSEEEYGIDILQVQEIIRMLPIAIVPSAIIVVHTHDFTVGFIVDAVCEVIRINESAIEPAPPVLTNANGDGANYIRGVSKLEKGLLILLDLNNLISLEILEELMNSTKNMKNCQDCPMAPKD